MRPPTPPIPGQPHPDVEIIKATLRELKPGEMIPPAAAAKAINATPADPAFWRRSTTARHQLEREGVVIVCATGQGFVRELPDQTLARVQGRETKTIRRRAGRNETQLRSINPADLPADQRPELYAMATIQRSVKTIVSKPAREKLLAAAKTVTAELTVSKALEVLREREQDN